MLSSLVALALTLAPWSPPQEPEGATPPAAGGAEERTLAVEKTAFELSRLRRGRERPTDDELQAAATALQDAIEALLARRDDLEWDHLARCIQILWRTQQAPGCASVCEAAIERFEPTLELRTQLGMCRLAMAQEARTPAAMQHCASQAATAFLAARELGDSEPAFVLAHQALATSGDPVAALADFDLVRRHATFGAKLAPVHSGRAVLCLLADKAEDALHELDAAEAAGENDGKVDGLLRVRLLALAGQNEPAIAKARDLWADDPRPSNLTLLVDVLGATGATDEALQLLRAHPIDPEGRTAADLADILRSRAVLEYLLELRNQRPADLRQQLQQRLGHEVKLQGVDSFRVIDTGDKGDDEGRDLNGSPIALGHHLRAHPFDACSWANAALFVVCVEDTVAWQASPFERQLLLGIVGPESAEAITGKTALAKARGMLAGERINPFAEGILTATRLLREP